MLRRRPLLAVALISLVASAVLIAIGLAIDWFPTQASTAATEIDTLWDVLLIISVPIFVLVMAVALYSVYAFRARPGDTGDGAPIHGNTRLEVVWVTIPFIIVTAIAAYAWVVFDDIEASEPNSLVVNVTGQQFAWSFSYPQNGKVKSNHLVLPKDRPVEFRVHSKDVIHDFWVPAFRLKTDAVPGITTKIRVKPDRIGRYDVVCAELCGIGHSTMRNSVRVVAPGAFKRWISGQKGSEATGGVAGGGGGATETAAAGKQLFTETGCSGCHALADAGSNAKVGPGLNDLAADAAKFGKAQGQSPEAYVKQSIENPNAFVVKGFGKGIMPGGYKGQLSPAEIDTLVKYLLDVGAGKGGK